MTDQTTPNEPAILPMPRHASIVAGELNAARHHLDVLRQEVALLAALDLPPIVVCEGGVLLPQRELVIPVPLREALQDAMSAVRRLELEYYDGMNRALVTPNVGWRRTGVNAEGELILEQIAESLASGHEPEK